MKSTPSRLSFRRRLSGLLIVIALAVFGIAALPTPTTAISDTSTPSRSAPTQSATSAVTSVPRSQPYLSKITFDPANAKYAQLIDQKLHLTLAEKAMLQQNGFVVSDRLGFPDFTTAYAYIFKQDLPVLITTDSMLQAIHQTYDDLLFHTEETILQPMLLSMLSASQLNLVNLEKKNTDPDLASLYQAVQTYISVPRVLLSASGYPTVIKTPDTDRYAQMATSANNIDVVNLFGSPRQIDFTQFTPRSHYLKTPVLQHYFQAMMWLSQIDYRLVEYDGANQPVLNLKQLASAMILRDVMAQTGTRETWNNLDGMVKAFAGLSDNMTLTDLDRFLLDVHLNTPADALHVADPARLLKLLTTNDYGQQRITSQMLTGTTDSKPANRPVSFLLLGQRYAVDSEMISNLVYDRLVVNGQKVFRPAPSPLDVMYTLGNDRALTHLQEEISKYGYQSRLTELRSQVNQIDPAFWQQNVYNRWLGALRTLNTVTTKDNYPQSIRTAAWADKMLHTELASWTQLRHDNVLYTKFDNIVSALCEYPAGYVEPYPEFYAALRNYAQAGEVLFTNLDPHKGLYLFDPTPVPYQENWTTIREKAIAYFMHLDLVAGQLQTMAEKELRQEPFSVEEEAFLKETIIRKVYTISQGCTTITDEERHGWYADLFPWKDDSPALISDIFTNATNDPSSPLYPPLVLHVGTGNVAATIFTVDTNEGQVMYVGPAFTYFEVTQKGYPPVRLQDGDWRTRLKTDPIPQPPGWTTSFRIANSQPLDLLTLDDKKTTTK